MIDISIKNNLDQITSNLPEQVRLVCVTKFRSDEEVEEVYEYGIRDIAENRVQNLIDRRDKFSDKFNYHMIGRLQTNKVKNLVGWVELIHSLDRESLLYELEKQGEKNDFIFNCLIQLNVSKEESKTGIYIEDLDNFIEKVKPLKYVNIKGFMTMAPFTDDRAYLERLFNNCKKIFDKYKNIRYNNFNVEHLSMGMSNDYMLAIEEGANMVRIGSKIFEN